MSAVARTNSPQRLAQGRYVSICLSDQAVVDALNELEAALPAAVIGRRSVAVRQAILTAAELLRGTNKHKGG